MILVPKSWQIGKYRYFNQIDAKDIKCPLEWWGKHESLFSIVVFLACQIFRIMGLQIEIEKVFSLVGILTNLKRCKLKIDNLDKLIFINKN